MFSRLPFLIMQIEYALPLMYIVKGQSLQALPYCLISLNGCLPLNKLGFFEFKPSSLPLKTLGRPSTSLITLCFLNMQF